MIFVENMQLSIGGNDVLKDINLHLAPGDIYGLLGPNGAGKSTTIHALLGLLPYTRGEVMVLGGDPAEDPVRIRQHVGVMPERAGFYEWMTAPAYLKWYGRLYNIELNSMELSILLQKVGLDDESHRPIGLYSRGMQQRLAVARALLPAPRLLILDEPTNGLDPKGRREIHNLLVEFAEKNGAGILLCTHLLDDVGRLCNRIGIVDNGRTILEGNIADLLSKTGEGGSYRLRLESSPDISSLPDGLSVTELEDGWWRVQIRRLPSNGPSHFWNELWRCGWKILEISSDSCSLEKLYMRHTGKDEYSTLEMTS